MMKKIVAAAAVAMMSASVAMAAPAVELGQGKINAGYNYTNYDVKGSGNQSGNDFYIQGGLSDKFAVGFENENVGRNSGGDFTATDVTLQYKLDKNFSLVAGNRHYSATGYSNDATLWGLKARTPLSSNMDGYAAFQTTSQENEFQVGALVKLSSNMNLDVNYKDHEGKGDLNNASWKGLGFGLNVNF